MAAPNLREKLAAIEHERWSDWQRYVHGRGKRQADGSMVLSADDVAHWDRQIETDYADLTEAEKDSNREQVDRYLPLVTSDGGKMTAPATTTDAIEPEHTGGMIALIPTEEDAAKLAVDGGDPAGRMHLTLVYLGDDVTGWDPEVVAAVHEVARRLTDRSAELAGMESRGDPVPATSEDEYIGPGQRGPLTLTVFAHSHFNPNGGPDDQEPCMVYLFSGGEDLSAVNELQGSTSWQVKDAIGEVNFPEQHPGFTPHVTAGFNLPPDALSYTGPVVFDRLRVALADEVTDYHLGGVTASAALDDGQREALTAAVSAMVDKLGPIGAYGMALQVFQTRESLEFVDSLIELPDADDALTAAAATELPPAEWFERPADLKPGTGHTVDGKRVYGYLAEWNTPHIGLTGQKVYPPRSRTGYRYYHTKTARVAGQDGAEQRVKVGHLTFGMGHAPMGLGPDYLAAGAHYDNSGYRGAKVRVGEDDNGIWYSGALVSGIEGPRLEEFEESDVSGDWRRIMGNLELIAAHCVNVGGYPKVGMSLAASGEPLALVASAKAWGNPAAVVDVDALAAAVVTEIGRRSALAQQRDSLLAALDDSGERVALLLDELDDELDPEEIAFIDGTPDPTDSEVYDVSSALTAAVGGRRKNWVEQTGTGHLPRYIKRISKHLRRKGMTQSRAIAVAVNVVKRMCATGDLNFKGVQQVNAKSRAQACAAVAEWEAKKAQARAT